MGFKINDNKIKLYTTKEFIDNETLTTSQNKDFFKKGFELFFCGKIEALMHLVDYPILASKATTHSIYFITKGQIFMGKNMFQHILKKGDCLVVPAYNISSIEKVNEDTKGYFLNFSPDILNSRFISQKETALFKFMMPYANSLFSNAATNDSIKFLFQRLDKEYLSYGLERPKLVISYLVALLYELHSMDTTNSFNESNQYQNITDTFKKHLFEKVKELHRTSDYANIIGITPNHLNKVLKRTTGKSPITWINEALVLESKVLLEETSLNITEVASELGIYEPSYFSRLFKKITNQTPTQYRKGLNNPNYSLI